MVVVTFFNYTLHYLWMGKKIIVIKAVFCVSKSIGSNSMDSVRNNQF